jgi:hypothetical protein
MPAGIPNSESGWDILLSEFEIHLKLTPEEKELIEAFISFVINYNHY